MASREELLAANAAIRKVLEAGAEARLRAIPGVRHVSVGLKVSSRKVSRDLCIRVYVQAKRPEAELAAVERIPREIDGVPTDVNVMRRPHFTIDNTQYRPLKGGSMISNRIVGVNQSHTRTTMEAGTFGCTATRTSDGSPVLLSNWHVLMANGARIGDRIYQPAPLQVPDFDLDRLPVRTGDPDDAIAFIVDARITDKVDAGIARLDVSSCCRCCGLDFRDEIVGLSEAGHPPSNNILGMRAAVPGSTVYKVGIATGRTVGTVADASTDDLQGSLNGVDYALTGQIEISPDNPDEVFSALGDSGSVVIDEDGWIVGLLFGAVDSPPDPPYSYANHIADVCSTLGITINLTQPHGTAGARVALPRATFPVVLSPTGAELYAKTRARLHADPAGAWLWALAEEHREEIVKLVTTQRRVSVVWQRAGGPAIFATALNALRAGDDETLPSPPGGGTLEESLARVGSALAAHGSEALRAALAKHRAALLAAARGSATLSELLGKLRPHALAQAAPASQAQAAMASIAGEPA
jgi:hypothetical protein